MIATLKRLTRPNPSARKPLQEGLPEILNFAALVAPGVMLGKDGSLTTGYWLEGDDLTSSTPEERNAVVQRLNDILARYDSGWMIHHYAFRIPITEYPHSVFPDRITQAIDDERRRFFESEGAHFRTMLALTVTYRPPRDSAERIKDFMYEKPAPGDARAAQSTEARLLEAFTKAVNDLEDSLRSVFRVERMRDLAHADPHGGPPAIHDDLLSFTHACVTGDLHPVRVPPVPNYIDALIGSRELVGGIEPKVGDQHLVTLSIDGFPQESFANILDGLDRLPIPYRWTSRFIFLDPHQAVAEIKATQRKWETKKFSVVRRALHMDVGTPDLDALEMCQECSQAVADSDNGAVRFGYYSSTLVFMGESRAEIDAWARQARKIIQNAGFACRYETLNTMEAWLGSLPGHGWPNLRRPLLHTLNLADLLPLTSIWTGATKAPCPFYPPDSPPLMVTPSEGATPFHLNLHCSDIGHTLIVGPTGSGKSTLLATLQAQFLRYPGATIFSFDKGYSIFPLVHAAGGEHYDIAGDHQPESFYPLGELSPDNASEIAWAIDWVCALVELNREQLVTPGERNHIADAIRGLASTGGEHRTLTHLVNNVQDTSIKEALRYYTAAAGTIGGILDSPQDTLRTSRFQVFELEHLMHQGPRASIPVLTYLFRRIEQRLKGQPALLVLDEAWLALGNPVFRERIREWLKVLRKANCAVVLATQSLSDLTNSGILDVLQESCPTKIYLPNPEAMNRGTPAAPGPFDLYKQFGLNDAQIGIIAGATPKREYYIASPAGRRKFSLGLGPTALAFVGASGKDDIALARKLIAEHGDRWTTPWLERRGIVIPS